MTPRTAVLVIVAVDRPLYRHYLDGYWRALIDYVDAKCPDVDVFLLCENGMRHGLLDDLAQHVIEDPNADYLSLVPPRHRHGGVPGMLSKTIHALKTLRGDYDFFFRTNLSSMIDLPRLRRFVAGRKSIGYAGAWPWTDALRSQLVHEGWVGAGKAIEDLAELDDLPGNTFLSGSGFFLGAAAAAHLVDQRRHLRWGLPDDVAIGLMFSDHEELPGFSLRLTREQPVDEMVEQLRSTDSTHIRLEHFPVETASALWNEMERNPFWR